MTKPISYEAKINSKSLIDIEQERERSLWFDYTKNLAGMFEAIKYLKTRELMFLKGGIKVRWCRATNVNFLKKVLQVFDIEKKMCTAYASLDHYPHIPMFTADLRNRTKESDKWIKDGGNNINKVDFGLDLDCKSGGWQDLEKEVLFLTETLNEAGVNYAVWKTTHGFHIVIPYEQTHIDSNFMTCDELRNWYLLIATEINDIFRHKFGRESVDLSAYMQTRVFRCPYLLDDKNEVCLPLHYSELNDLFRNKPILSPTHVLINYKLQNRGVFINNDTIKKGVFETWLKILMQTKKQVHK